MVGCCYTVGPTHMTGLIIILSGWSVNRYTVGPTHAGYFLHLYLYWRKEITAPLHLFITFQLSSSGGFIYISTRAKFWLGALGSTHLHTSTIYKCKTSRYHTFNIHLVMRIYPNMDMDLHMRSGIPRCSIPKIILNFFSITFKVASAAVGDLPRPHRFQDYIKNCTYFVVPGLYIILSKRLLQGFTHPYWPSVHWPSNTGHLLTYTDKARLLNSEILSDMLPTNTEKLHVNFKYMWFYPTEE